MYVMNHEDWTHSSAIKHTKNQIRNEGKVMEIDAVEEQDQQFQGISLRL